MAFAQLTFRESLRDIEACRRAHQDKLHYTGIRSGMFRNTLANANQRRDWRIYAELAQAMIRIARPLYADRQRPPSINGIESREPYFDHIQRKPESHRRSRALRHQKPPVYQRGKDLPSPALAITGEVGRASAVELTGK